jgi:hypothetical protein
MSVIAITAIPAIPAIPLTAVPNGRKAVGARGVGPRISTRAPTAVLA